MLFTPGPTAVSPEVREVMARQQPNSAVQPEFTDLYSRLCTNLQDVYDTHHDVIVPGGEGILGLEAAIASLVSSGDRVLCISNGLYGDGFADFVDSYDGDAELVSAPYDSGYDLDAIANVLDAAADTGDAFSVATLVHCETPTGTLNTLGPVLDLLDDYETRVGQNVISVVDAVSSLGGVAVPTNRIDVCLGASQKCFSAPPGLTTAAVSERAWTAMEQRDPASLYTNLLPWRDISGGFPYTHLDANIAALDKAVSLLVEEGTEQVYTRHQQAAERCRQRGRELGLSVYPDEKRTSPTVTAFELPGHAKAVQQQLNEKHGIVLATSLSDLADNILRVGHMGYNADVEKVEQVMDAIEAVMDDHSFDW